MHPEFLGQGDSPGLAARLTQVLIITMSDIIELFRIVILVDSRDYWSAPYPPPLSP